MFGCGSICGLSLLRTYTTVSVTTFFIYFNLQKYKITKNITIYIWCPSRKYFLEKIIRIKHCNIYLYCFLINCNWEENICTQIWIPYPLTVLLSIPLINYLQSSHPFGAKNLSREPSRRPCCRDTGSKVCSAHCCPSGICLASLRVEFDHQLWLSFSLLNQFLDRYK